MARRKTVKRAARRIVKAAPAKARMLIAKAAALKAMPVGYVPKAKFQSVMARYRMAMAKLNAKRHEAMMLRAKLCDLECRIEELEKKLTGQTTTPS